MLMAILRILPKSDFLRGSLPPRLRTPTGVHPLSAHSGGCTSKKKPMVKVDHFFPPAFLRAGGLG